MCSKSEIHLKKIAKTSAKKSDESIQQPSSIFISKTITLLLTFLTNSDKIVNENNRNRGNFQKNLITPLMSKFCST